MKSIPIRIRKFLGQNTRDDKTQLLGNGTAFLQYCKGYRTDNGILDGDKIGQSSSYYVDTAHNYPLSFYIWDAGNGKQYFIYYDSDGAGADGAIRYFTDPSTITTGTLTATDLLTTLPTNMIPSWADPGNGYLYAACGQAGVYKIYPIQDGTLTCVAVTSLPATSNFVIWKNRSYFMPCDETVVRWGPINDYERYQPTLAEIDAGTYGPDFRVTFASQGVRGFATGLFPTETYLAAFSNKDVLFIVGTGNSDETSFIPGRGYGMSQLKAYTSKDNVLYWLSNYNEGCILGASRGAIPVGGKYIQTIGKKEFEITIFDATEIISTEFKNVPDMDCEVITAGMCDSRGDWENTFTSGTAGKIYANSILNAADEPGFVKIVGTSGTLSGGVASYAGIDSGWTVTGASSLAIDGNNATYFSAYSKDESPWSEVYVAVYNMYNTRVLYYMVPFTESDATYTCPVDLKNITRIELQFEDNENEKVTPRWTWPVASQITSISLVNLHKSSHTVYLGELVVTGSQNSTTHITSQVFKVTGLTSANNALGPNARAAGRFLTNYVGTSADGTGIVDDVATDVNAVSFTGVQIRGRSTSFVYGDLTATVAWLTLTAAQLTNGYDLDGNAEFAPDVDGNLWVQFRIPMQVAGGLSPKIDAAGFYFWKGNNHKSIAPMGYRGKNLYLCARKDSDSLLPDKVFWRNDYGGCGTIVGQEIMALLNYKNKLYSSQGKKMAEYGNDIYNPTGTSATETAIERYIRLPRIEKPGYKLWPKKISVNFEKHISGSSLTPTTGVDVGVANPLLDWAVAYSSLGWDGLNDGDPGISVQASDGNVYCLFLYDYSGATVKIDLVKITPGLVTTRTNIYTAPLVYSTSPAMSMCMSNDGNTLYMFWTGNHETTASYTKRIAWFRTYNVLTGTLGTATRVDASDLTTGSYVCVSSAVATNGDIYCSFCHDTTTDIIKIYKSTNGATFVQDTTVTPYAAQYDHALFTNRHGYVSIMYVGASGTLYCREKTGSGWGTGAAVSALYTNNHHQISLGGADYVVFGDNDGGYYYKIYKNDGTGWTLVKTITVDADDFADAQVFTIYNNMLVLFYTNSGGSLSLITGIDDVWSDELAVEGVNLNNILIPRAVSGTTPWLLWGYTTIAGYWRPFVITNGDMTGNYPVTCTAITDQDTYTVFQEYEVATSPVTYPVGGYFPDCGGASYLDVDISSYGPTKITGIDMDIEYTED